MSKLETILLYQETEKKKQDLEKAVLSTPARQQFGRLHKVLKTQQATIQQLGDDMEAKLLQAGKLIDAAGKFNGRLELETSELDTMSKDEESTGEEMTELRRDVEKLQKEINQMVRDVKALMSEVEKAKDEYAKANQTARDAKKEYDQVRLVCEQERNDSAAEIEKVEAELKKMAKELDATFLEKFDKVRQHYPDAVVPVKDGKCSGCNMSLATVALKQLNSDCAMIDCENCGRILYKVD